MMSGVGPIAESPRFHVVEAAMMRPRFGEVAARPVYVYLPDQALHDRRRRFPVLYAQDGQNVWDDPHACFGHGGWYLNRIIDELTLDNRIEPVILVGIPNSAARYRDYAPGRSFADMSAHAYATWVCDVVKPGIEKNFPARRGRAHAALLGSSLGGIVSLWIAQHQPQLFGGAACLSGAFQVKDRAGKSFAEFVRARGQQDVRVYLDAGTVSDGAALTRRVRAAYVASGWRLGHDLVHHEERGAEHNERWWRDRVWRALVFLFGVVGNRGAAGR